MNSDWQQAIRMYFASNNAVDLQRKLARLAASICWRQGLNPSDIDDVAQDVWLKVLSSTHLREKMATDLYTANWYSYFARLIANHLYDLRKKAANEYHAQIDDEREQQ